MWVCVNKAEHVSQSDLDVQTCKPHPILGASISFHKILMKFSFSPFQQDIVETICPVEFYGIISKYRNWSAKNIIPVDTICQKIHFIS